MLDAAVAVFSKSGFHDASMDEIAARAGISKPMVYAYLGSKEELFIACLHREGTRLMEAIVSAVVPRAPLAAVGSAAAIGDGVLPPDEQLWRGLRAFFTFVGDHRDGWSVLYRQARGQAPFATELAAMRSRMVDVVAGLLARVIAAGSRQPRPADVMAMAYALVGAGESLADWVVDHVEESPEATATRLMNFVWLGAGELLRGATWHPSSTERTGETVG
ncbi:TetR family transcriptional regulator [Rugosimonospora africana]|uniref:TetR family transcriptional regulator n=1 Tax=Rugosimonospora africana TaxID=556532 RepID=A0A8J3VPF4_9ACTN|nr:TetR/AcrR family transcriptional regulator [Rugosimonospora africana]GIH13346.1 TetR family transcriptional regulator [Rugosimonospora africana]